MGSDSSVRVPNRRMDNLVVTQTGSEVLIYDERTFALHTLNDVAVRVWENLDDAQTLRDLTVLSGLEVETVKQSLKQLEEINLLDGALSAAARPTGSRRSFLKKVGLTAVAIPAIVSVTAPAAAQNTSGQSDTCNLPCSAHADCTGQGVTACEVCYPTTEPRITTDRCAVLGPYVAAYGYPPAPSDPQSISWWTGMLQASGTSTAFQCTSTSDANESWLDWQDRFNANAVCNPPAERIQQQSLSEEEPAGDQETASKQEITNAVEDPTPESTQAPPVPTEEAPDPNSVEPDPTGESVDPDTEPAE